MTFLHLIADYGTGDPAFGEVIHRFHALMDDVDIHPTSVPSFSSIATGFWIAQYGLYNPSFNSLAIYANTAPRQDKHTPRQDNEGEELVYAQLENDIPVIAVNSEYTLSFIRNHIQTFRSIDIPDKGSQFRSRDIFPQTVVDILTNKDVLGSQRDPETISSPPENVIAHIDGYGNIKTTIRQSDLTVEPKTEITVGYNGTQQTATYTTAAFDIPEGTMAFAPGSAGGDDPYMELFMRGDSAARQFDSPHIGESLKITYNT